ncbi:hypothetical protein ACFXPQ_13020 [Streptomyces lydicus]|uniref:hypothetical protein n=1 Tax=Streptomyces lydicus TaxID=47763 RepID=UPI0036A1A18D
MPLDVYAALGALVRAEARRTKPVPAPSPADHDATQQPSTPPPPAEPLAEPSAELPGEAPAEPPAAVIAVPSPAQARKGLLRRMVHRLTALLGRGRRAGSGTEGPRSARGPGAGGPGADRPERHPRQDGARPAEPPSGSPLA